MLTDLSRRLGGKLAPEPAGPDTPGDAAGVAGLLADDSRFPALARQAGPRFRSDDRALVGAQLVREWVAAVAAAAITAWSRDRRLLDWSAPNVVVRVDGTIALRRPDLVVPPGDGLDALLATAIGHPVRRGDAPAGTVAAVAGIIAAARRAIRSGDRHYWGTAALTAANTLTAVSHEVGARADLDRAALLARRPDLARTVELLTVDDGQGDTVSCARRLTCCLLVKLPGEVQCGTCNLRDRDQCRAALGAWARAERARHRPQAIHAR